MLIFRENDDKEENAIINILEFILIILFVIFLILGITFFASFIEKNHSEKIIYCPNCGHQLID